ncbi:AvrD family protein [Streptomyces sp. NPDC058739]|uniref:AvrD family protein n=1 Tax=Streptomyces sp. NPDC058739 TaxID=3346618 RepID=UPI003699F0D1
MSTLELTSIDDFLGPRDSRFLGEGFKRVEHALTGLTITPPAAGTPAAAEAGIEAVAHVTLPGLWSRKGNRHQKPHLSSIDVMLFAARLTGLYAAHTHGLAPDSPFEVLSVDMKAGSGPDEEGLEQLPVSGRLVAAGTSGALRSTTLDCRIGSLTARVHARHAAGRRPSTTRRTYHLAEELPGPWNDEPYGVPHGARRQLLTGVGLTGGTEDDHRASARVALVPDGAEAARDDAPATMVDALVSVMQLGQVLLYTLDGVERARSNNLWMRRARIRLDDTGPGTGDEVTAALRQARLLPAPTGTWRSAEVAGALHGVRVQVAVAHLLGPPEAPSARGEEGR